MSYICTSNPSRKFATLEELAAAQKVADESGSVSEMNTLHDLTWVEDTTQEATNGTSSD